MLRLPWLGVAVAGALLSACAAPPPAVESRINVRLAVPSEDAKAIAQRAGESAGVPVRYAAAVSPQWHALTLRCTSEAECEAAVGRLRADRARFAEVLRDERRRVP
jgi:hypothetical protein